MNNIIKVIIIDDEENEIFVMSQKLKNYCEGVDVVATARNISDAAERIAEHQPDLIFLDIQMPEGTGFELLQQFKQIEFGIIFFTSYDEYALQALAFSALPYLLKPVKINLLKAAIEQFRKGKTNSDAQLQLAQQINLQPQNIDRIFLPDKNGMQLVLLSNIVYLEANGPLTHIYTTNAKRFTVSKQLGAFQTQFSNISDFFRIHDKYLINSNNIQAFQREESTLTMLNGHNIIISARRKSDFIQFLKTKGWL